MLMEARIFTGVHQIVLHGNTGWSFVSIKTPSSIVKWINMMNDIIWYNSTFWRTEGINASHITKFTPAKVMNMIECYKIIFWRAVRVSPYPANWYPWIANISYFIMCQLIIACIEYNYTGCTWENISAIPYNIIINGNIICNLPDIRTNDSLPILMPPAPRSCK